jgi:hypothetical protein
LVYVRSFRTTVYLVAKKDRISVLGSLVTIMLALFTPYYLRESVAQTILVIIINICLFTTSHVQASYLMEFALSSIIENRQRSLLSTMRKFLAAVWVLGSSGIVITLLGNLLSQDALSRALFGRLVFAVWTIFGSAAIITIAGKFGYDLLQTLNDSIELNSIPELVQARTRVRLILGPTFAFSFVEFLMRLFLICPAEISSSALDRNNGSLWSNVRCQLYNSHRPSAGVSHRWPVYMPRCVSSYLGRV